MRRVTQVDLETGEDLGGFVDVGVSLDKLSRYL